jgi:hypothetical protein
LSRLPRYIGGSILILLGVACFAADVRVASGTCVSTCDQILVEFFALLFLGFIFLAGGGGLLLEKKHTSASISTAYAFTATDPTLPHFHCRNCGDAILPGAKFCEACGTPTPNVGSQNGS